MQLRLLLVLAVACAAVPGASAGSDPNACDAPGEGPNLVVGDLPGSLWWGRVGDVSAYGFPSATCNLGTCWADWFASSDRHPVFTTNLYRLEGGRFEQIGMSWVTHRYFALSQVLCTAGCLPTDGSHLGVGCSTSNSAAGNSQQGAMGPRSEVNATTGVFPFPHGARGQSGDAVYKRLQVADAELDPALHPGATYFVEAIELAADDAAAGNAFDNVSYRELLVAPAGDHFALAVTGPTVRGKAVLEEWALRDPDVVLTGAEVPGDGRFWIAARVVPLGGGRWSYEYAVENLDSHRSVRRFAVALTEDAAVEAVGFHDVHYHSGEPYSGADWTAAVAPAPEVALTWSTAGFDEDPLANALRWGTTYNFRFVVDAPPATGSVELALFRPGEPATVTVSTVVPQACDGDGICEAGEDCASCPGDCVGPAGACCGDGLCDPAETACACAADCGPPPVFEVACLDGRDDDCDGRVDCTDGDCCPVAPCDQLDHDGDGYLACEDCDDADASAWATPAEVSELAVDRADGGARIAWTAPAEPGGESTDYDLLRSPSATDLAAAVCLPIDDPAAHEAYDPEPPSAGGLFVYLVRAVLCPGGAGPLGDGSSATGREAPGCL